MSASRFVDSQILCDFDGCIRCMWTSELSNGGVADVRRVLRGEGWVTGVKNPDPEGRPLDYCREHKP